MVPEDLELRCRIPTVRTVPIWCEPIWLIYRSPKAEKTSPSGSIGFVGAMAWIGFQNSTARLLDNALAEFVKRTSAARVELEIQP